MTKTSKWEVLKRLPTDYTDYGGTIERWETTDLNYPDFSGGCQFFVPLYDQSSDSIDLDWGVCTNVAGPRAGLLTWEHQAGFQCFSQPDDHKSSSI